VIYIYRRRKSKNQTIFSLQNDTEMARFTEEFLDCSTIRFLGKGHFGEVFLGKWNESEVAMKRLKDDEEFEKETNNLRSLKHHPHVVSYFGLSIISNIKYIVMEYLENGSFMNFLSTDEGRNLSFQDLFNMIIDACRGMIHLNQNNLVHRDLAARNLLVFRKNKNWSVKISDFGMTRKLVYSSQLVDSIYSNNSLLPVRWTAPEVIRTGNYYKESDIWSFGVTAWEILSKGRTPYSEISSNSDIFAMIENGSLTLQKPENCPENIWEAIFECFNEQSKRPSFKKLLNNLTVSAYFQNIVIYFAAEEGGYPRYGRPEEVNMEQMDTQSSYIRV